MKKLLLLLCLGWFSHFAATAQLDIKFDPVSTLLGTGDLSLEYVINGRVGLELGAGPKFGKTGFGLFSKSGLRGFFAAKYYFSKKEIGEGFALGIYAKYKEVTYNDTDLTNNFIDETYTWKRTGLGIIFAYKAVFDGGFTLGFDLGLGRAVKNQFFDVNNTVTADPGIVAFFSGDLLGRIVIGYRLIK